MQFGTKSIFMIIGNVFLYSKEIDLNLLLVSEQNF